MKLYLIVLLYISLITNKADQFYLLYISHLGELLAHILCPFLYWVVYLLPIHLLKFFVCSVQ